MTPKRLLTLCLWLVLIFLIVPLYLRIALDDPVDYPRGGVGANDFKTYYIAAILLQRGQDIYSLAASQNVMQALSLPKDNILYLYPSLVAIVTLPLTSLTIENAARVWNMLDLIWLMLAIVLITNALELHKTLKDHFVWFLLLLAISVPATGAVRVGQANVGLFCLLSFAFWGERKGKPVATGIGVGITTLIKVFPVAFIGWWMLERKWRQCIWCIGTIVFLAVSAAAFLALTGHDGLMDVRYATEIFPHLVPPMQIDNRSLQGFFSHFALAPFLESTGVILTTAFVLVGTGIGLLWVFHDERYGLDWGLIISTLLLVSTMTWSTTSLLLVIPFAVLLNVWVENGKPFWMLMVMGVVYLTQGAGRWFGSPQDEPAMLAWLLGMPTIGMILLWMLLLYVSYALHRENLARTEKIGEATIAQA